MPLSYADADSDRLEYSPFLRNSGKDQIHEDYGSGDLVKPAPVFYLGISN